MIIRLQAGEVRETGRNTMGVRLMNLPEDDRLVDAAVVPEDSDAQAGASVPAGDPDGETAGTGEPL